MPNKYQEFLFQLNSAVFDSEGVTEQRLRTAVKSAVFPTVSQPQGADTTIPPALRPYLDKVGRYAYKITDRDIETLKAQGYSEEAIFELTVSAAVGAGFGRLKQGLYALNGGQ
jgi:hypothetical protein